jgi:leucyl aminopeptidase
MKITIKDIKEVSCDCNALILPFTEGDAGCYDNLNISLSGCIRRAFSREFRAGENETLLIPAPEGIKPERILLVGLGKKQTISEEKVRQAGGRAAVHLRDRGMKNAALSSKLLATLGISPAVFTEGFLLGHYTVRKYTEEKEKKSIDSIVLISKASQGLKKELALTEKVSSAVCLARDLVNTPANDMTPSHLAKTALSLKNKKLSVKVIGKRDAEKLGMWSYLSVARGSKEPPKFIVLEYKGTDKPPLVIIGKSITFDSGGISLKPSDGMEKMKYDMAGGAAVLGVIKAVSELSLPVHLIALLPATENLISGCASRPGDVVRAINGKSIEIISTDAEGRMTLADAIGYAKRFRPKAIIDIATLTGACSIALGNVTIAMMGNDRDLLERMTQSGHNVYERVWEMPLFDEYRDYLKSDIADLKNSGGRSGSLLASASFLKVFAGDTPWVHLDIAGTAWLEKEKPYVPKGASGIGVRLITDFIKRFN